MKHKCKELEVPIFVCLKCGYQTYGIVDFSGHQEGCLDLDKV